MKKPIVFILLIIFNTFDGLFTYFTVINKLAKELNPLMACIINNSPPLFLVYKLIAINAFILLLWKYKNKLSNFIIGAILAAMVLLFVYEIVFGIMLVVL